MLLFSPSAFPWWVWMLGAAALAIVAAVAYVISSTEEVEGEGGVKSVVLILGVGALFYISLLASLLCAIIGIVRFVKWVWYS